jgi:diguanylate cyclase (GGDEF)-like protein
LKGATDNPLYLKSADFDIDAQIEMMRGSGNLMDVFIMLMSKERSSYLFGQYEEAYQIGNEMDTMLKVPMGAYHLPEHYFYRCLSLLAVYHDKTPAERRAILRIFKRHLKKMRRCAELCPANYEPKYLLVRAEMMQIAGQRMRTLKLYDQAVKSARENGYTSVEALANERAALCYLEEGIDESARGYMAAAIRAYRNWGAFAKIDQLKQAHPRMVPEEKNTHPDNGMHAISPETGTDITLSILDLSTVMQASHAISSEIMLERLLQKIMKYAVVNAGAQRGFFILDTEGRLTIEAAMEQGLDEVRVLQSIPIDSSPDLAVSIVNYVHRRGESVILGNATQEGAFTHDGYIMDNRCKSILATPIMNKGKLSGILYLENNLTTNAFTTERLEVLRLLSSQAAISLENARLFELATTDGLTKLFVHRYFQLLLDQEIIRSRRYMNNISLIMMDIDDFKHFNDAYGHQFGDQVLRRVARAIKNNVRGDDFVARYGGEEFVAILPETDSIAAMAVAEKIRSSVECIEITLAEETLGVTISLGVATFPFHAADKEDLIKCADSALYASKHAGKNRACVFKERAAG